MDNFAIKLGVIGGWLSAFVATAGLIYRATIYWTIPVAQGEPYGFGDIIDFGFAVILIFITGFTVFVSLLLMILWQQRNIRTGSKTLFCSVISVVTYFLFHPVMPRLL